MNPLLYRCPSTGLKVQGLLDDEAAGSDSFVSLECPACGRMHFVNPATKRVLGANDSPET